MLRAPRLSLAAARWLFLGVTAAVATLLGTVGALTQTGAGRAILARVLTDQSGRLVRGRIMIGALKGNFATGVTLDQVEVRDTLGFPLAGVARLEIRYRLSTLLARRIILERVHAVRPRIHLVQHRGGRLNFEEVLRLGEGPPDERGGGKRGPLIEFRNVTVEEGIVTIRTPWNPPGELRTATERDSALRAQRLVPGRRIEDGGPEGLQQIRTLEGVYARLPRVRIATPDGQPLLVEIDSLTVRLSDPLVDVAALRGVVTQARDTLWFDLPVARLPGTHGSADGLVAWPQDTLLFDFSFAANRVALADLRFVSPGFPDWTGRGELEAYSFNGTETQFFLRGLELGDGASGIAGTLTALTHRRRGLGFRGLDLVLREVDLEVVRPYLDTVPFRGRISGTLRADGYFDGMNVALDWTFFDQRVEDRPLNRLAMAGEIALGAQGAGEDGLRFRGVRVSAADLDLATLRLAAPAVILEGRLTGTGVLDGAWRNVTFSGELRHQDGDRPASAATGWIRLDTRAPVVVLDGELEFAPLAFEGIRRAFPGLTIEGDAVGSVRLSGPTDRLWIETNLRGDLGHVVADGSVGLTPTGWRSDSLEVRFSGLDLATVRGGLAPPTALAGRAVIQWTAEEASDPEGLGIVPSGSVDLVLGPSWIREFRMDTAVVRFHVADSVLRVDTAYVAWPGGETRAQGALGWRHPHQGRLDIAVVAPRLAAFDSMLAGVIRGEETPEGSRRRLDGALDALLTIRGALDSFDVSGEVELGAGQFAAVDVPRGRGRFFWQGGSRPTFDLLLEVDSLRAGRMRFGGLRAYASGAADSLLWRGYTRTGAAGDAYVAGRAMRGQALQVQVDTVDLRVLDHRWQLREPVTAVLGDSVYALTPVYLRTDDGAAFITVEGSIPNAGEGEADIRVVGLDLRDLAAVLQRDTAAARGLVSLDLRLTGTATRPELRGTGALTGPVFGDFRAPLGRVALRYAQRRLNANVTLWRTGRPLMEVNVMLPLDLGWRGARPQRQLPGQVAIRAVADSMDLAVVEAFTANLRRVRGTLSADVTVQGTWDRPRLGGTVTVRGGRAAVPSLGVVYGPLAARLVLGGDSIVVDSLRIHSRRGTLDGAGAVRLERLTHPVLDLRFRADNFLAMDVPDYVTLEADGDFRLRGPVFGATLTGSGTARNSVLYFSDLVSKTIVNLEDPLFADLVDTATIRRRGLGAAFQSRFLDSLTIRDFRFTAAEGVWLRSSEANIQLEGEVVVQKTRRVYRLDGTFTAPRGTYTFKLGPVTRAFDVTRGVVRYFNTPDLNADLDIEARHLVQSGMVVGGGTGGTGHRDIEVIAQIRGTLRAPRLTLESTFRPPLSQSDIVSLLVLGQTLNSQVANAGVSTLNQRAMTLLFGALSSELERAFVGESGLVDLIEIRPGLPYGTLGQGASLTRLAAGWQVGTRWWVSLNAGFCPNFQQFDHRNFGVSLDYRLSREWSLQASAEPVQACLAGATTEKRYQLGGDLRWNREF
jgi:translocation and assembly module TamB